LRAQIIKSPAGFRDAIAALPVESAVVDGEAILLGR
jgi:hypothetical protein